MAKHEYDNVFQKVVIDAIKHHSFLTSFQRSLESKLLFDADKLDGFHPLRYRKIISGIKKKKLSKVQVFLIANAAKVWLKTMRSRYHFSKSREMHDTLMQALLSDKEAIQVAKEFGVDVVKLVK